MTLPDVTPRASSRDAPGMRLRDVEHVCDLSCADPAAVKIAYFHHVMLCQLYVGLFRPSPAHVMHVVPLATDDYVGGVDARRVVAGVSSDNVSWEFSVFNLSDNTMRAANFPLIAGAPVAGVVYVALPFPALVVWQPFGRVLVDVFLARHAARRNSTNWRACLRVPVLDLASPVSVTQPSASASLVLAAFCPAYFLHTANTITGGKRQ